MLYEHVAGFLMDIVIAAWRVAPQRAKVNSKPALAVALYQAGGYPWWACLDVPNRTISREEHTRCGK